ncbi:MAG TPA: hypothetical protein VN723_11650 [Rhizomicrobium sp.]|nr:hypothetical protein [Rhizomicrobium sp.]
MNPTSVIAFFCDDVRAEADGRYTIIGLHSDNLQLAVPADAKPAGASIALPKLAIFVRISFDANGVLGPVRSKLINPGGDAVEFGAVDQKTIEKAQESARAQDNPIAGVNVILQSTPYLVPKFGRAQFEVMIGSNQYVAGILNLQPAPKA